jgi:DNA-binding transcriptional regulator YiaG
MPNIASVLKEEIARLARKELKGESQQLKKASAQYRSDIAALKRRVTDLERQLGHVAKSAPRAAQSSAEGESVEAGHRFSAKGLSKLRQRLELSAGDLAKLIGVSGQSIYKWEAGKARPRAAQIAAIAAVRGLSKKAADAKLAEMA